MLPRAADDDGMTHTVENYNSEGSVRAMRMNTSDSTDETWIDVDNKWAASGDTMEIHL
jgi:hypothetical protein